MRTIVLGVLALAAMPAASAEDKPNPTRRSARSNEQRAGVGLALAKLAREAAANLAIAAKACTAERADASFAAAHGGTLFARYRRVAHAQP